MRAVIYARYSSDQQRTAAIEDQLEICRRYMSAARSLRRLTSRTEVTIGVSLGRVAAESAADLPRIFRFPLAIG
jgi:DNA invertase Pin-like site-specific DNA recombinase